MYGRRGNVIGNEVLIGGVTIAVIFSLVSFILADPVPDPGAYGICLPSPNQWNIPPFLSWIMAVLVIGATALLMVVTNKKFNFIPTTEPLLPTAFVLLLACNVLISDRIGMPLILMAVNAVCLYILFETYEKFNSSQEFFLLATFLSFGSMVEYVFLMMIPVYVVGGLFMKSFRGRELIAFIFGILAPYWIMIGFGLVDIDSFSLPVSSSLIMQLEVNADVYVALISVGFAGLIALVASLYNSITLLNGNSRVRCMHLAINFLGYICLIFMIGDFNNIMSYSATVYMWCAFEIAMLFAIHNFRNSWIWLLSLLAVFMILYFIML